MALAHRYGSPAPDMAALADELLAHRSDPQRQAAYVLQLRQRVRGYEIAFQMPSERVHAAIEDGTLRETHEVCRWIMDYDQLQGQTAS